MTVNDEAGQTLRNGKCKRTVEEQQAANDQKRAALGDISNKALQRCEQVSHVPPRARPTRPTACTRGGARWRRSAHAHPDALTAPSVVRAAPAHAFARAARAARSADEQGISKLGVASTANVQTRAASMRMTQLAARQQLQDGAHTSPSDDLDPMSVEKNKPDVIDIDTADHSDTQLCTAYVHDIYEHLGEVEQQHRIMVHYMHSQKDINSTMRGILIDWLVEVAEEYRLVPETLYLAVNYIDRFLQCVPVNRGKLQLVGVTCMLIASCAPRPAAASPRRHRSHEPPRSQPECTCARAARLRKYEEIHPPAVDEFVYISDNTYTRDEVRPPSARRARRAAVRSHAHPLFGCPLALSPLSDLADGGGHSQQTGLYPDRRDAQGVFEAILSRSERHRRRRPHHQRSHPGARATAPGV